MIKLVAFIIAIFIVSTVYSKEIPVIKAEIGYKVDFSEKSQRNFERVLDIRERGEKPKDDKEEKEIEKIYYENSDLYNTTKSSIWDISGEGDSSRAFFPQPYKVKVSSQLKDEKSINYKGENLCDNSFKTAWVEGREGYGLEEYIEYYINNAKLFNEWNKKEGNNEPYYDEANVDNILEVQIFNGYVKSEKAWRENSRVKKFKMYIAGKPYAILELKDTSSEQRFDIPNIEYLKVMNRKDYKEDMVIRFEIMEVYPGEKYKDTAITEISLISYGGCCFPASTKISLSDNSVKTIDKVKSGDEILTYNSADNKFEKTKVISVAKVPHNNLVEIDFGDKVITSTDDHPYLSENGWKSCKPNGTKNYKGYEGVKELKVGDKIYFIGENGKAELKEVKGIKKVDKKEMCYTVTKVESGDNFIADGAVVGVEELR